MRYLSEDGVVFNTVEECKEHEQEVKRKKDNQDEKIRLEKLNKLKKEYDNLLTDINKWLDSYYNYFRDYPERIKKMNLKSDDYFELKELFDFLVEDFGRWLYDED